MKPARTRELLRKMATGSEPATRRASLRLLASGGVPAKANVTPAVNIAEDEHASADALELLAIAGVHSDEPFLKKLMGPREPEPVQLAAVRALGHLQGDEPARFLLQSRRATRGKEVFNPFAPRAIGCAARARIWDRIWRP
jgi:hypothetical protein